MRPVGHFSGHLSACGPVASKSSHSPHIPSLSLFLSLFTRMPSNPKESPTHRGHFSNVTLVASRPILHSISGGACALDLRWAIFCRVSFGSRLDRSAKQTVWKTGGPRRRWPQRGWYVRSSLGWDELVSSFEVRIARSVRSLSWQLKCACHLLQGETKVYTMYTYVIEIRPVANHCWRRTQPFLTSCPLLNCSTLNWTELNLLKHTCSH